MDKKPKNNSIYFGYPNTPNNKTSEKTNKRKNLSLCTLLLHRPPQTLSQRPRGTMLGLGQCGAIWLMRAQVLALEPYAVNVLFVLPTGTAQ